MPDEPGRIDLSEFRDRKPAVRKKKVTPDHDAHPGDIAREAASRVADDPGQLAGKTIEELSEMAIRRMAHVVLRGGDDFLPTTLKEASDSAKTWASVASMEAARRAGKGPGQAEDDPVVKAALAQLLELQRKAGPTK